MQGLQISSTLSANERADALKLRFADLIKKSNTPNKNIVRTYEETHENKKNLNCPSNGNVRKEATKEVAEKNHNHNLKEIKEPLIKINLKATKKKNLDVKATKKKNLDGKATKKKNLDDKATKKKNLDGAKNKKRQPVIIQEEESKNTRKKSRVTTKQGVVDKTESEIEAKRRASREALENMKRTYDFEQNKTSMIEFDKLLNIPPRNYYNYSRDMFFS